jgi:hypothetical protein
VFFEVLLAASYGLLLHGGGSLRVRAGLHYIAINLVASLLFLIGVALLYGVTGTLTMADIAQKLPLVPAADRGLLHAATALLAVAFLAKAAFWPLNFWLPAAYSAASAPSAAMFAILTKVGVYAILRAVDPVLPGHRRRLGAVRQRGPGRGGLARSRSARSGCCARSSSARLAGYSIITSSGTVIAAAGFDLPALTAGRAVLPGELHPGRGGAVPAGRTGRAPAADRDRSAGARRRGRPAAGVRRGAAIADRRQPGRRAGAAGGPGHAGALAFLGVAFLAVHAGGRRASAAVRVRGQARDAHGAGGLRLATGHRHGRMGDVRPAAAVGPVVHHRACRAPSSCTSGPRRTGLAARARHRRPARRPAAGRLHRPGGRREPALRYAGAAADDLHEPQRYIDAVMAPARSATRAHAMKRWLPSLPAAAALAASGWC